MVYDEFVYCCGISVCIHYIHVYVCACVIGRILGIVLDMISPVACPSIFSGEAALLKTMYTCIILPATTPQFLHYKPRYGR